MEENSNVIYILNLLRGYFNDLNSNRGMDDEVLSLTVESLMDDLKDFNRNGG